MAGCGNGIIEAPAERCEGTDFGGTTCESLGYAGGNLACNGCQLDTQGCFGVREFCGDGQFTGLEACDAGQFALQSTNCADYGLGTGTLSCQQATCRILFDGCSMNDVCNEFVWYSDGTCHLCEYYSQAGRRDTNDCGNAVMDGACGADGQCADYHDPLVGQFTCVMVQGRRDPDCGCGNGVVAPPDAEQRIIEWCDGSAFLQGVSRNCSDWGFTSGTVNCSSLCDLDFEGCF